MSTGRRGSRSPIVMPSCELDAHLHSKATQITKNRTSKVAWNFIEDAPMELGEHLSNSYHGDDLMTPPDVLLQLSMKEAKKAAEHDDSDMAIEHWVRATALARIVHGDVHWVLAKTHIQLAKVYQQLKDLHEQALIHATKGHDILLSPSVHMMSHDPDPESTYQLSLAHCIIGKALTSLEKLPEAERAFIKAEKYSEKFSKLTSSDIQLDLDIVTGMGQLSLRQKKYELARNCFTKALDYTKAAHGTKSSNLVHLLRSLATAEIQTSNIQEAIKLLEEALQIAEHSHGIESLSVAEILMGLSRAHRAAAASKKRAIQVGIVEEQIDRALSIYTSQYGPTHEATITCKDELCQYLSSHESSRTRAEEVIKEIIVAKKTTFGESSQEVGHSYKLLGTVYLSGGKISEARKYLKKARHVYGLVYGTKHRETQSVARALEIIAESNGQTIQSKKPIFKTTV